MKKIKKEFAVKLWFDLGCTYVTVVKASNMKEATLLAHNEAKERNVPNYCGVTSVKVKELPTCVIRTAFGHIPVKVRPNPYYNNEIIINDNRVNLPDEFNYWDINSIIIHNAGLPVIATITTDKGIFVAQNNVNGCCKRFEIIK